MNLRSCSGCGLVYDLDRLTFPDDEEMWEAGDRGEMDNYGEWDGDRFIPILKCQMCNGTIRSEL